jgi:hypothetical protein
MNLPLVPSLKPHLPTFRCQTVVFSGDTVVGSREGAYILEVHTASIFRTDVFTPVREENHGDVPELARIRDAKNRLLRSL